MLEIYWELYSIHDVCKAVALCMNVGPWVRLESMTKMSKTLIYFLNVRKINDHRHTCAKAKCR